MVELSLLMFQQYKTEAHTLKNNTHFYKHFGNLIVGLAFDIDLLYSLASLQWDSVDQGIEKRAERQERDQGMIGRNK